MLSLCGSVASLVQSTTRPKTCWRLRSTSRTNRSRLRTGNLPDSLKSPTDRLLRLGSWRTWTTAWELEKWVPTMILKFLYKITCKSAVLDIPVIWLNGPPRLWFPPDGSAKKDNNASTLQFKTKYMVVFKTIYLFFLLCTALWWQIKRRGGPFILTLMLAISCVPVIRMITRHHNNSFKYCL